MPKIEPTLNRAKELIMFLTSSHALKEANKKPEVKETQDLSTSKILTFFEAAVKKRPIQQEVIKAGIQPDEITITQAASEFVRLIASVDDESSFINLRSEFKTEEWRLQRAGMLGVVYGREVGFEDLKKFRNALMFYTRHDELPVSHQLDPRGNETCLEEVLRTFDGLFDIHKKAFTELHIATQRFDQTSPSMLEGFLRHVNGKEYYSSYTPTIKEFYRAGIPSKGTVDDWPGPGFVIKGLGRRAKLFTDNYIESLYGSTHYTTPKGKVENDFRELIIETQKDLPKTTFGTFRGLIVIRNSQKMQIDRKPFALFIYNDHFQNSNQEIAFLLPNHLAKAFLSDPMKFLNEKSNFHPNQIIYNYHSQVADITLANILGGLEKSLPFGASDSPIFFNTSLFYDKWGRGCSWDLFYPERKYGHSETHDLGDKIHRTHIFAKLLGPGGEEHPSYWKEGFDERNFIPYKKAHDEVRDCVNFALAQYVLFKEAFRLFNFGFSHDPMHNNRLTQDNFKLLKYAIAARKSGRYDLDQKPILVATDPSRNAYFTEELTKNVGLIDTGFMADRKDLTQESMLWHRAASIAGNKTGLDIKLIPGSLPPDKYDLSNERVWKYFAGKEETQNWLDFSALAFKDANLIFYQRHMMNHLIKVMKSKKEGQK